MAAVVSAASVPHEAVVSGLSSRLAAVLERTSADVSAAKANRVGESWASDDRLSTSLDNLSLAAKAISDAATKLVLVLKSPAVDAAAAASICDAFGLRNEEVLAALAVVEKAGAGGPLWLVATQAAEGVSAAAKALVDTILRHGAGGAEAPRATGVVWEASEQFKRVPKSNRVAYRRSFMAKSSIVRDTVDEFQAMVNASSSSSSSSSTAAAAASDAGFADDFDFEDMDGDDAYEAGDLPLATVCLDALKMLRPTLKTAMDAMDAAATASGIGGGGGGGGDGSGGGKGDDPNLGLERNADLWLLCQRVTDAATELGAALYPPLDTTEVGTATEPFKSAVREIGAHCALIADSLETGGAAVNPQAAEFRKVATLWEGALAKVDAALMALS